MTIFIFSIKWYDELEKKNTFKRGIIPGTSFTDVVERLIKFYGEKETLEICSIRPLIPDDDAFERSTKTLEALIEDAEEVIW